MTGALLHFKFFSDFVERARLEVDRGEHWDSAAQYSAYAATIAEHPDLDPYYAGSVVYEGTQSLVDLGFMMTG